MTPGSLNCQPVTATTPLPTTGGGAASTPSSVLLNSQYPANAVTTTPTPLAQASNGTTGAVAATLAAGVGATTYICGFNVSAVGGTATLGPVTVAGLLGGTQSYEIFSSATGVLLSQGFNPCLPASAVNTAITATTVANGTATAVHVNIWGYRL